MFIHKQKDFHQQKWVNKKKQKQKTKKLTAIRNNESILFKNWNHSKNGNLRLFIKTTSILASVENNRMEPTAR